MGNRFAVQPEVVEKRFIWKDQNGDDVEIWIKIKKALTVGEDRIFKTAGWKGVRQQGEGASEATEINMDWKSMSFARAQAYLVDWSLEDDRHTRMPLTVNSLMALHIDLFELIETAISKHVEEMEAEKKARSGTSAPEATSA
jgi:hypothetical protein